jgi:hypothetical protein
MNISRSSCFTKRNTEITDDCLKKKKPYFLSEQGSWLHTVLPQKLNGTGSVGRRGSRNRCRGSTGQRSLGLADRIRRQFVEVEAELGSELLQRVSVPHGLGLFNETEDGLVRHRCELLQHIAVAGLAVAAHVDDAHLVDVAETLPDGFGDRHHDLLGDCTHSCEDWRQCFEDHEDPAGFVELRQRLGAGGQCPRLRP